MEKKLIKYESIFKESPYLPSVDEVFARKNRSGNFDILMKDDGYAVTRLDVRNVYPVGSDLSTQYEHPEGIELSLKDVKKLGIMID